MLRVVQFVDIFICHADEGTVKTEAKLTWHDPIKYIVRCYCSAKKINPTNAVKEKVLENLVDIKTDCFIFGL